MNEKKYIISSQEELIEIYRNVIRVNTFNFYEAFNSPHIGDSIIAKGIKFPSDMINRVDMQLKRFEPFKITEIIFGGYKIEWSWSEFTTQVLVNGVETHFQNIELISDINFFKNVTTNTL